MMRDLKTFGDENECLRVENKTLKEQNASMTQTLQSQTKELHQHKNRLDQLKFESEKQNALVQVLSDLVVSLSLSLSLEHTHIHTQMQNACKRIINFPFIDYSKPLYLFLFS